MKYAPPNSVPATLPVGKPDELCQFVDFPPELTAKIQKRIQVHTNAPGVTEESEVYMPGFGWDGPKGRGLFNTAGGYLEHGELEATDDSVIRPIAERYPEPIECAPAKHLPGTYIYGGFFANHFGHFMTNYLARLWYLSAQTDLPIVIHAIRFFLDPNKDRFTPPKYLFWFLKQLGISKKRLHFVVEPTVIEKLIIPYSSFQNRCLAYAHHKIPYERVAERVMKRLRPTEQPVYLSRSRLKDNTRPIANELILEEFVKKRGFKIVYPERLSLKEQVKLFNTHRYFIGPQGSAFHNVLFSLEPAKMKLIQFAPIAPENKPIEITMRQLNYCFIDLIKGNRSYYIRYLRESKIRYKGLRSSQEYRLGKVKTFLKEHF